MFKVLLFLPLVFITTGNSFAETNKCNLITDDAERLICYDEKFPVEKSAKQVALDKLKEDLNAGEWFVNKAKSKADDSVEVIMSVTGKDSTFCPFKKKPHQLTLRCIENKTSLVLTFGGCFVSGINGGGRVLLRHDKEQAININMTESTDNKALGLWSGGKSIPVIKRLLEKKSLYVRATPFNDSPVETTYNIAGLKNAIKPLRAACGW